MLKQYGYFDGKIKKLSQARIAPNDIGILRGYGVFDFYRTFNGRPFLLKEHVARLNHSAGTLSLRVNITEKGLAKITNDLLLKNKIKEGFFRIVITGGPSESGIDSTGSNMYVLVYDAIKPTKEMYEKGASLMYHEHLRAYPEAKTNNYITAVSLQPKKKALGAVEILYGHAGKILECSTANIFIVKKGKIITPKENILIGITRNFAMKIASKKYSVIERAISKKDLFSADECFITSTTKDILPIVKIDGKKIGDGKVGEVTKDLMNLFDAATAKN